MTDGRKTEKIIELIEMFDLTYVFALLPFVLFLGLLLFRKLSLTHISVIVLFVVILIQTFYWKLVPIYFLNSFVKGFFVAFDIFLIVLGAVFFLEIMKVIKVVENIGFYLGSLCKDYRVQVVLLAWFLINFLEGMAGFGTPGAIVAPILVSLGLSPLTAVIVSLLGNSSAGVFGAVGTPIRIGFAGLDVSNVASYAVLLNGVGILMPVFMVYVLSKSQKNKWRHFGEVLPFAIWSGLLFFVTSLMAVNFGQEFVSIIGSLLAIVLIIISIKLGLFLPKKTRTLVERKEEKMSVPLYKVVLPYLTVFGLLVLGKILLKSIPISFPWGFQYSFNLFNPGLIFIIAGIPFALIWGDKKILSNSGKRALLRTVDPFLVILAMSTMIQMMISSGNNLSGNASVLSVITNKLNGSVLPFIVPYIGAFGSFLTGSITISNILFGSILVQASGLFGLNATKILALQISGAAIGNSMAISDIMAAEAVVGMKNKTRKVIRGVIGACLVCLSILGIVGVLFT